MAREPGTRRPTINDVARLAGVSKKTVSRVINDSPAVRDGTRRAVQAVIAETGYVPDPQARGLAFRRSFLIGLAFDGEALEPAIVLGLLDALAGSSFELVLRRVDRASAGLLDDMRGFVERQKLFGLVLAPPLSQDPVLAQGLEALGCRLAGLAPAFGREAGALRELARAAGRQMIRDPASAEEQAAPTSVHRGQFKGAPR